MSRYLGSRRALLGSLYRGNAVNFDGTNDWLTRGAGLTGAVDSKLWTVSFWFKSGANGGTRRIFTTSTAVGGADNIAHRMLKDATNNFFRAQAINASATTILDIQSSNASLEVADGWQNIMFSVDMADVAKRHLYIDDVSDLATVTTFTDDTMDFTRAEHGIMAGPDGASKISGDVADFWFATGVYIDLSLEANRRKFIDENKRPVYLGESGERPVGTSPIIFFSGSASTWHTNRGTGGGFTINGALTEATTSPSD